jgi:hypothetical protein
VRLALIAECAHAYLVDRLVGPSSLGTRLANDNIDRVFALFLHWWQPRITRRSQMLDSPPFTAATQLPLLCIGGIRDANCAMAQLEGCEPFGDIPNVIG